jgi:hypothetical protein
MSATSYERRPRRERKKRGVGRLFLRIAVVVVALALVFALGLALGEALKRDSPPRGELRTSIRTLEPLTQQRAP